MTKQSTTVSSGLDLPFTEEWIKTSDLEVDRRVQRFTMDLKKIERMVKNYNESALGVLTISRRNRVTNVILDGWHRWQTVKEVTDNQGVMLCHVFEGLTLAQEAQLFLDLNAGNQPTLLEKFNARIYAEDPVAIGIDETVRAYGFKIDPSVADGNIQAIGALERIWQRSVAGEFEPNLLQVALLVVSRAWGHTRQGAQAVILEGLAALYGVHTANLDVEHLVNRLQVYQGGPLGLHTDATQLAALRRGKVSMAVAELVTEAYNKGKSTKALPPWRKKRP